MKSHPAPQRLRFLFRAMVISWLAFPVLLWGQIALDVIPLIAAGRVAVVEPADVYVPSATDLDAMTPRFRDESCRAMPDPSECEKYIVPFTHTPMVLPLVVPLGMLPNDLAAFVCRLLSAAGLVGGMALLWKRIAHRSRDAALMLTISAMLLTPLAFATIRLGQSSSILFLSACYGVSRTRTAKGAAAGSLIWATTIVMKAFPLGVGVVALVQRRWRLLFMAAAWCTVLLGGALLIGGSPMLTGFLSSTRALRSSIFSNLYNRGIDGLIYAVYPSWNSDSLAFVVSTLVRIGVVVLLWHRKVRFAAADSQWAFGWVAILWFIPTVWFHYSWVIAAAAFVLAAERLPKDPRWSRLLPAVSAALFIGALNDVQHIVVVFISGLALIASLIGLAFLTVPAPPADDEQAMAAPRAPGDQAPTAS